MADLFTFRSGLRLSRPVPVASGVVIQIGELCKLSGCKATPVVTTTDNLTFIGPAAQAHGALDGSGTVNIDVPHPLAVYEYTLNATTDIAILDALQINSKSKVKKSATTQIARADESKLQATTISLRFNLPAVTSGIRFVGDQS